jgi:CRP-like cAMP-binding protein
MHLALSSDGQEKVLTLLLLKMVAKRTLLLQSGEMDRYIYFVNRGCLRMFYTGKEGTGRVRIYQESIPRTKIEEKGMFGKSPHFRY